MEYASGQIATIASGVTLSLNGAQSRVVDAADTTTNSALTGLSENDGSLDLLNGNSIAAAADVLNAGFIGLDPDAFSNEGGSGFGVAGKLTNSGHIQVGQTTPTLSATATLSAGTMANSGSIGLYGNGANAALLTVNGTASSSGTITIGSGGTLQASTFAESGGLVNVTGLLSASTVSLTGGVLSLAGGVVQTGTVFVGAGATLSGAGTIEAALSDATTVLASGGTLDIAGAVSGGGGFSIAANATLELGAASPEPVAFTGTNATLLLDTPAAFSGTISGFAVDDALTLKSEDVATAVAVYSSSTGDSTLTVTLSGGGQLAYTLQGDYSGDVFAVAQSGGNSTISFTQPAIPIINTISPIDFGQLHIGASASETISITNAAGAGAPSLDVTIAGLSGAATGAGSITRLAPGATDSTDISLGIATGLGGAITGVATLGFASDIAGNATPLPTQQITVMASVYREAAASFVPAAVFLHVGDPGTENLIVANADPADSYSESLIASVVGFSGGITAASGATGTIAPGASDSSSLSISFSTANTGTVVGTLLVHEQSVATGADALGNTDLGTIAVPVTVFVDNPAIASFDHLTGQSLIAAGDTLTLDLGTIAANTGTVTTDFAVTNSAAGPADLLSGSFQTTGSGAFSASGLAAFSGLAAGQSDTAPALSLDTSQIGAQSETIVLSPQASNPSGFSQPLAAKTLIVTANVQTVPPPVINVGTSLVATAAVPVLIGPLTISDPNTLTQPLTVTVTDSAGLLFTHTAGSATVANNNSDSIVLTGSAADVNAELASLTYTDANTGADTITVAVTDQFHATASQSIAVTTNPTPPTGAVFNAPVADTAVLGAANGLGGLSLSDPTAEANGDVVTMTFTTPIGTLSVKNPPGGATVTGIGTDTITLTGTVQQINATLADDVIFEAFVPPEALIGFLAGVAKHTVTQAAINLITGTYNDPLTKEDIISSLGGPSGKFFSLGTSLAAFELNSLAAAAVGAPPPDFNTLQQGLACIVVDAHIVQPDGTIFDFNPTGEFVFAATTQTGDTFDVQVRLQPVGTSTSASVVTQVAASVGNDRVTFGIDRVGLVWVNGTAVQLTQGVPDALSGGQLTQVSADTYNIVWNTGEVLTVTDSGSFLSAEVAPGPNNGAGAITGLVSLSDTVGNDLQLPDGTVLSGSLSTAQLYQEYADSWRVPQQFSLFDYGPGQTTNTFTDTNFPENPVTLADLPANVVAAAASVAAAAGITDPGVLAAAEFDYIASGGNVAMVAADASLLAGRTTIQEQVTPSGPPPVSIGLLADKAKFMGDGTDPIPAVFDVYLTGTAATDTTVDYTVVAPGAGFLDVAGFGGALPSGSIVIPAGQTTAQITIDVPATALGTDPSEGLELSVSSPDSTPIFAGTAQTTVAQPVAGPPPVPEIVSLTRLGTLTHIATNYTLDLGDVQYGEPLPTVLFGITNAAIGTSDALGGTITVAPVDGFTVTGATLPATLDAGQSYNGIAVTVNYTKFGPNSETITFAPQDTNNTGFSSSLPTQTLTITDNIVAPSMVFSQAWGDVHIVTYNGLAYNFQAAGEFTLAQSRLTGDSFDIQLRLEPWFTGASVTVIRQVAMSVGTDRVTIDDTRPDEIEVNGVASTLSATNPEIALNGGTLSWIASNVFKVTWDTGEEATVTDSGSYLNVSDGIPLSLPNEVGGLQGEDAGQANDFQLPDGTVLPQPLSYAQLYGQYADGWRVSQASSLFDYLPGQTTQTFTDPNFPRDAVPVSSLPADMVANAAALVAAAGITDPGLAQSAEEDYLATGDPSFIASAAAVQKQVASTTIFTPTAPPTPVAAAGVSAVVTNETEAASGPTAVTFNVFLTGANSADTTITYAVVAPGSGYLGAAAFGGTLPTGSVVIPAGQTSAQFTIEVPQGALGSDPSDKLQVQIAPTDSTPIFTPQATVTIANSEPVAGNPATPLLVDLTHPGALTQTGANAFTLNLGTLSQGQPATAEQLALVNNAVAPADLLGGTFGAPLGSGFTVIGNRLSAPLAAGASYSGMTVTAVTSDQGSFTETLTFTPTDTNASGFSGTLPTITLTIVDSVGSPAKAGLNSPAAILFPNVHLDGTDQQAVSVSNTAAAPAAALDVTTATGGSATASGSIRQLAPGATDSSSIMVGLDTGTAGQQSGVVALQGASDSGSGAKAPLAQTNNIDVYGAVYREAAASIAPISLVLHVGDSGRAPISVSNTDPADGFSETLVATMASTSGGVTEAPGDPPAQVAPGATDSSSLAVAFSTAQAAVISGIANISLTSDGGTGTNSLDGLGQTALGTRALPVSITVNNFAQAAIGSDGNLTPNGTAANNYTLNLGSAEQGSAPLSGTLKALNTASGPADWLNGSFSVSGGSEFQNSGFAAFSNLAAGSAINAGTVSLATDQLGAFSETVVLTPTDANSSGFSKVQSAETITVTGTITPVVGTAGGDVHMVTFDGLHYDFQATGDFVLARSTQSGDPFQIQMRASSLFGRVDTSYATEIAAAVGGDVVTFHTGAGPVVSVNGHVDTALNGTGASQTLNSGHVTETASGVFELVWNSGETLTVTDQGQYLDLSVALGPGQGAGSVQGLLGSDSGQANDFALPDGTVLQQPLSEATLLGQFADAWRVGTGHLLLDAPVVADDTVGNASVAAEAPTGAKAAMTFLAPTAPAAARVAAPAAAPAIAAPVADTTKPATGAGSLLDAKIAGPATASDVLPASAAAAASVAPAMDQTGAKDVIAAGAAAATTATLDPSVLLHKLAA
jgi:hypothetical protein